MIVREAEATEFTKLAELNKQLIHVAEEDEETVAYCLRMEK